MSKSRPRQSAAAAKRTARPSAARRKVIVFASLLGVLSLTSALLLSMAPAPLTPGAYTSLFAYGSPSSFDEIFTTQAPVQPGAWKYIFVHQSLTPGGDAHTLGRGGLGDHFLIGNGEGCIDGEIQMCQRWNLQQPPAPPAGGDKIDPHLISICLVGDFNQTAPTDAQLRHLEQLVQALQSRLRIPAKAVVLRGDLPHLAWGVGRNFPADDLREKLLSVTAATH